MPDRVMVFIDEQNVYREARRAFFDEDNDHYIKGNFSPFDLATLLVGRQPIAQTSERVLQEVRVYTGMPVSEREPVVAAAVQRRVAAWTASGATVITRPLRYLTATSKGEQKGIDVAIALDVVDLAVAGAYDVGVICSVDTDMHPAIELVAQRAPSVRIEASTWWSDKHQKKIRIAGMTIWNHRLVLTDYQSICDHKSYTAVRDA
jgi:uncharacterized LabA/DUF88 family protein